MIVITSPTGQVGQQLLELLADGERPLRVVARDHARMPDHLRDKVEVVEGSHNDPAVLARAFEGADAAFWLIPPNPQADDPNGHYGDFAAAAASAIADGGLSRVVSVSSLGRDYPRDAGLLTAAFEMDETLEATGVAYRSLLMPFYMENLLAQIPAIQEHGAFFMANAADRPLALVATRDIAAKAQDLLLDEGWSGQASVPVISPDLLTPNRMAAVVSEVLDRPVSYQEVAIPAFKEMMGQYMSDGWAQGLVDMVAAQNDGIYDAEQEGATPAPTSFRQWSEEVLKPAVRA